MIRVITIDDEEPALEEINYILNGKKDVEIVNSFTDGIEALEQIERLSPDVVFLDIEMPEINGFMVAREILNMKKEINIIFTTAFDQYAVEAFEVNALDYIMKPLSEERVHQALDKVRSKISGATKENTLIDKIQNAEKSLKRNINKIVIWKDDEIILLDPKEVYYFTVEKSHIVVVTADGKFKTKDTLDNWESRLDAYGFFRCHRSFLVNMNRVKKMSPWFNNTYILYVENIKDEIPLSRNRMKEFKNIIGI